MKHAVLMIAHGNLDHILREMGKYDEDFSFFIHWDKRNPLTETQREKLRTEDKIVYVGEEYLVNWGGYGIVRATLLLCKKALEAGPFDYYHLISGTDILVRNMHDFKKFFQENDGKNFLQHFIIPKTSDKLDKMKYFHHVEKYDIHASQKDNEAYEKEIEQQKKEGVERTLPDCDIYWGSAWWSLQHDCVKYLVSQEDFIEQYFLDTLIADEHFAQTVIMNSVWKDAVVNDNLRYISWNYRNGNRPAVLDRNDLNLIMAHQVFFARKINLKASHELIDALDTILFQSYKNVNTFDIDILSIIQSILKESKEKRLGLLYGVGGALVFFSQCLNKGIAKELVTTEVIDDLRQRVIKEFTAIDDTSYSSGRLGLLTAFEYSTNLVPKDFSGSEMSAQMEEMKSSIVNQLLNETTEKGQKEMAEYYKFFKTLHEGSRLNVVSRIAWNSLQDLPLPDMKDELTVSIHNIGLKGLSGLGLWKLSQGYGLNIKEWDYLLTETTLSNEKCYPVYCTSD